MLQRSFLSKAVRRDESLQVLPLGLLPSCPTEHLFLDREVVLNLGLALGHLKIIFTHT